jgi:hypothetical protein
MIYMYGSWNKCLFGNKQQPFKPSILLLFFRYIYFSDVRKEPKLWSCYTDGSHCDTISVDITHVNDMVFDHDSKRLYYSDVGDHSIRALDIKNNFHMETIYRLLKFTNVIISV